MSSQQKICSKCGTQLDIGLAQCPDCGAQVGTLFSEDQAPLVDNRAKLHRRVSAQAEYYQKIDKAQDRANNSVVLGLFSFFCPGIGLILSFFSVFMGIDASRTLRAANIEDGQGSAMAGIIIGVIALVAQICYALYVVNWGMPF
jgi:hypothetical protein